MVGIKEIPSDEEIYTVTKFLLEKFKDFTVNEIEEAIMLAASKELGIDGQHYQSFNIIYFGKILTAYREKRNKEMMKETKRLEMIKMVEDDKRVYEANKKEREFIWKKIIEEYADFYETLDFKFISGYFIAWEWLKQKELITIPNERIWKIYSKAKESFSGSINIPIDFIKLEGIKIALREQFLIWMDEDVNVEQLIKSKIDA